MTGRVLRFNATLRWGTILGEDEVTYFCHSDDVLGPRLVEDCRVAFVPGYARHRPRALEVRRLEKAP